MRTPVDVVKGTVVDYDERRGEIVIRAKYSDWRSMVQREYKSCLVQLIDSRPISNRQRKTCYKLLREIAEFTGMTLDRTKAELKRKFAEDELGDSLATDFSLSNVPMSVAAAFQRYLVRLILDYEIPLSFPLLDYVDDVPSYVYACAVRKKCCVCGRRAELHHHERIGMGRNRDEIDQEGMLVEPLCRDHHTECHSLSQDAFDARYHIRPVKIDALLKAVYHFDGERKRFEPGDGVDFRSKNQEGESENA